MFEFFWIATAARLKKNMTNTMGQIYYKKMFKCSMYITRNFEHVEIFAWLSHFTNFIYKYTVYFPHVNIARKKICDLYATNNDTDMQKYKYISQANIALKKEGDKKFELQPFRSDFLSRD